MGTREAENVSSYLKNKGIQISSNSLWLSDLIRWYNSHIELRNDYGSLEEYACVQWLLADLYDVQHACLPPNSEERVMKLNGKYSVQINWMRDIGQSCYSQLQSLQHLDESEVYFSEDEPKKQTWEPRLKRVLMMEITDGVHTLKAMEYSPIPKLIEPFLPGTKVVLSGPIECRNRILLLKNENVTLLGGEVEHLYKKNSLEVLLSNCLNLTNENETTDSRTDHNVGIINHQTRSLRSSIEEPQHSAIIGNDVPALNGSNYMMDEDDEFLCDLPDEVLDCPEDFVNDNFDPSPVLDVRTDQRQEQRYDNEYITKALKPIIHNKPSESKKPKLFPSLEDLRPVEREPTPSIAGSSSTASIKSTRIIADNSSNHSFASPPSVNQTSSNFLAGSSSTASIKSTRVFAVNSSNNSFSSPASVNQSVIDNNIQQQRFAVISEDFQKSPNPNKEVISIDLCDENAMDYTDTNNDYPQLKKVEVKIDSIIKLKIRNGEWLCCASVIIENQLVTANFSNQVIEQLFGVPAAEVETWRGQMSLNPSLKKKVNDLLKTGQTKLKTLKCPMTLEYSTEDCTPEVVEIHLPSEI